MNLHIRGKKKKVDVGANKIINLELFMGYVIHM